MWVAREMCVSVWHCNSTIRTASDGSIYFVDAVKNVATFEHPLTCRFIRILERERLNQLVMSSNASLRLLMGLAANLHRVHSNLTVSRSCQDCNTTSTTKICLVCSICLCDFCFSLLHPSSSTRHSHVAIPSPVDATCSDLICSDGTPNIYCKECRTLFCVPCFTKNHEGTLTAHRCLHLEAEPSNGSQGFGDCSKCGLKNGEVFCDYCRESFCGVCFNNTHKESFNCMHTRSTRILRPLCMNCGTTRATIYCEDCVELSCSSCFGILHASGNRFFHSFTDASNFLLLLKKLEPEMQEWMSVQRTNVLKNIIRIQATLRGYILRRRVGNMHKCAMKIQNRWRRNRHRKHRSKQSREHGNPETKNAMIHRKRSLTSRLRSFSWRKNHN